MTGRSLLMRLGVLALIGMMLGGCGDSEEDQIQEVVNHFEAAAAAGRAEQACSLMSVAGRRQLVFMVANDPEGRPRGPVRSCVDALPGISGGEPAKVTEVEYFEGDEEATVGVDVPGSDDPDAGGSVVVVREDGTWRIGTVF